MPDKPIGQLPELTAITDSSLLPVEQSNVAYHTKGATWRTFVQNAVASSVADAESAALDADDAASRAEADAVRAESAAAQARQDRDAIQGMTVSSTVLSPGDTPTLSKQQSGGVWNLAFGLAPGAVGPQGPVGPAGPQGDTQIINYNSTYVTAAVEPAYGNYFFNVNDQGHLILTYAGETAPDYSIDDDEGSPTYGHLLWEVE